MSRFLFRQTEPGWTAEEYAAAPRAIDALHARVLDLQDQNEQKGMTMPELHEQQTYTLSHGANSTAVTFSPCTYCNGHHAGTCPRIRAIEYHQNGVVKRVEFK